MITKFSAYLRCLINVTATCTLAFMLIGCGDTAAEMEVEDPVEYVEVEGVIEESETISVLELWLPAYPQEFAVSESWLTSFMEENGDVVLEWQYVPVADYYQGLAVAYAAGALPDIALFDYNALGEFQYQGGLYPVGELVNHDNYLVEALDLVTFDGDIYGIPWLRAGCTADYQYLAAFDSNQLDLDAVARLFDYLTQPQFQAEFLNNDAWYPTNPMVYAEFGLECDLLQVVRLEPALVESTIQAVRMEVEALAPLLGDQILNDRKATAVVINAVAVAQAVPVFAAPSPSEAVNQLDGNGLLLGAIMAPEPFRDYPAGNYTVTCQRSGEVVCVLQSPEHGIFEFTPDSFSQNLPPVPFTTCIVEEGSRKFCWSIDGMKFCLRVG